MAKLKEAKTTGEPGWKWRRIVIFPVVAFACWRLMELENDLDTRLNDSLASFWFLIVLLLVLSYTGFATIQDIIAIWRTRSGLPYSPTTSVEPETGDTVTINNNAPGGVQQVSPIPPEDNRAG